MKVSNQPRQLFTTWALVSVYAVFWLVSSTHHFFAPEHHHETKICSHAPNEKHIHGTEYAIDDCTFCQFLPVNAELLEAHFLPECSIVIAPEKVFGEVNWSAISPTNLFQPRAPPARLV